MNKSQKNIKRQRAKVANNASKRRMKINRLISKHGFAYKLESNFKDQYFDNLINDMSSLSTRTLQQFVTDIKSEMYHFYPIRLSIVTELLSSVELILLEKMVLK